MKTTSFIRTFVLICILHVVNSSSSFVEIKSDQTFHLLPLVKCQPNGRELSVVAKMCIEQCPRSGAKAEVKNMRVLDKVQPLNKIAIFICHSYQEVWNFDESWLFSKTKNLQDRSRIPINETECKRLLHEVCKGIPCKTSSSIDKIDEYEYASTITKTYSYSNGAAINLTAVVLENGELFLHGLPGIDFEVNVGSGKVISPDKLSGYFWSPQDFLECPMKTWQVTQCLVQPSKSIVCPDLGLNLWEPKTIKVKHCEGREFYHDDKGILLEHSPSVEKLTRARYIEMDHQLSAKESNMVSMMNEALRIRDELTCDHQCLELSNMKHVEDSVLSSSNSFWRYSMGKLHECVPLYRCDFEKGMTVCQDPMSVNMNCWDEIVSWDPEKDYASFPTTCNAKRAKVSEYKMRTKQGIILFNSSGAYLEVPRNHMVHIKHLSPHLSVLKTHSVRDYVSLVESSDSFVNENTELKSRIKESAWKRLLSLPESFIEWIEDAENDVKKAFTLVVGVLFCLLIFWILRKRKQNYISQSVSRPFRRINNTDTGHGMEIYEI